MSLAKSEDVQNWLEKFPEWKLGQDHSVPCLERTYAFKTYLASIACTQEIANAAEEMDHHPTILIQWRKITISLYTHDKGGITHLDFQLAEKMEKIYENRYL